MPDLRRRVVVPEIMDQPGLDAGAHARALRGLERINRISATTGILWKRIRRVAADAGGPVRVLDVACGGGDVLLRLARRASRGGVDVSFAGCDISATAVAHAQANSDTAAVLAQAGSHARSHNVRFFQHDILAEALPESYDVVTCNLFLHHVDENSASVLLRRLREAATRLVLVHDLIRSPLGYAVAFLGTRVLSRSPIVRYDGPVSVQAAFTLAEARELAARSGMAGASVSWQWPFRFLLEWRRT